MNQQEQRNATLVTIVVEGKPLRVDANSVRKEDRETIHGKYDGTQVNSPAICMFEGSAIVWPDADKLDAAGFTKPNLGILAKYVLEHDGHTVTKSA